MPRQPKQPSITYSDFEMVFKGYAQPPSVVALQQVFVGVKEVLIDEGARTARITFQQPGQAQAAYEATLNSETRTGIYDRVIAQYMPYASFDSMVEFSKALGAAMDQPQRRPPRRK